MKPARAGLTLVELLLATVLFGLLLTMASYILIQGLAAWSATMSRTDEENSVLVASSKLVDRLTKTDPRSLTMYDQSTPASPFKPQVSSSPAPALSFLAGEDYLPLCGGTCSNATAGAMEWNRFLVWYEGPDVGSTLTGRALWLQTVWLNPPGLPRHAATASPAHYSLATFTPDPTQDVVMVHNLDVSDGFMAGAPLESLCLTVACTPPYHVNPITFSIHLQWESGSLIRDIVHTTSAEMMENTSLDPGTVPLGPTPSAPPPCTWCSVCCPCCSATPNPAATSTTCTVPTAVCPPCSPSPGPSGSP